MFTSDLNIEQLALIGFAAFFVCVILIYFGWWGLTKCFKPMKTKPNALVGYSVKNFWADEYPIDEKLQERVRQLATKNYSDQERRAFLYGEWKPEKSNIDIQIGADGIAGRVSILNRRGREVLRIRGVTPRELEIITTLKNLIEEEL